MDIGYYRHHKLIKRFIIHELDVWRKLQRSCDTATSTSIGIPTTIMPPRELLCALWGYKLFHSNDWFSENSCTFATEMNKNLYIISGCNGAGKTTASYTVLPEILDCKEFVNADEIARGLSPFNPDSVAIEAGKLMLKRIDELLGKGETFSIETTLATKSYINLVRRAQAKGYVVKVLFFWLNSPELAQLRVSERVANGGHNIPQDVISRRYVTGICNLFNLFMKEVDSWVIFDNSENPRKQIASGGRNANTVIDEEVLYLKILSYVK